MAILFAYYTKNKGVYEMTNFATLLPVAEALWPAAKDFLGYSPTWTPTLGKSLQELVCRKKNDALALALTLKHPEEMARIASNVCQVVNDFLKVQNFSLQLRDEGSVNMFYAAAVMKLLGEFKVPAEIDYYLPKINKPAMRFGSESGVKFFVFDGKRIASIPTKAGFSLLITEPRKETGFGMVEDWEIILRGMKSVQCNGAIIPMSVIDEMKIDVSGLQGMSAPGPWIIQEALMAARFALTPKYVKFESAFAYSSRKGGDRNEALVGDFVADFEPYIALAKPGNFHPLATGLIEIKNLSDKSEFED